MEIEEKMIENPKNIFLFELGFFILAQILGIFSGLRILEILKLEKISLETISFWDFIFGFAIATFLVLFLIRFLKFKTGKNFLFRGLFILAISFGSFLFFSLWLGDFLTLILLVFLIFFWFKKPNILIHDFLLLSGIVGIGSIFGLRLTPVMVVLFLILFSIYDVIAVYKTKHMIKMAKEMITAKAILGLILPSKISDFKTNLKEVFPGGKFLILGGGDIIFPLILCVSLVPQGILKSLIIAFFATIGLTFSFHLFVSQKTRKPIPALPPIALFSIIGYLITILI
jgi:presenilin-like A22 family membrane protease